MLPGLTDIGMLEKYSIISLETVESTSSFLSLSFDIFAAYSIRYVFI
jgi:hypothetical protein